MLSFLLARSVIGLNVFLGDQFVQNPLLDETSIGTHTERYELELIVKWHN